MREVNLSSPHKNQAASVITHALYDRRALDCTSTLPLVNSLNSLTYLTTSSARIRQILTQDGGVERLVSMLKRGSCSTPLESLKWWYALQCVVNIGVRGSDARAQDSTGSESIRTRVVEADIVPVVATLLDNYLQRWEKIRASNPHRSRDRHGHDHRRHTRQRGPPPPIDVSLSSPPPQQRSADLAPRREVSQEDADERSGIMSSPPDRAHFSFRETAFGQQRGETRGEEAELQPSLPSTDHVDQGGVRTRHRRFNTVATSFRSQLHPPPAYIPQGELNPPPMTAGLRPEDGRSSPVETPTTPTRASHARHQSRRLQHHPSSRMEDSNSGDSDEGESRQRRNEQSRGEDDTMDVDDVQEEAAPDADTVEASQGMPDPDAAEGEYSDTFNIRHRSVDGRLIDPNAEPLNPALPNNNAGATMTDNSMGLPPVFPMDSMISDPTAPEGLPLRDLTQDLGPGVMWMPRQEHIVLSLQLLAYVSKYCHLRTYFLNSHLVPGLRRQADPSNEPITDEQREEDEDNEYCLPDDFNLFPLVEKFTLKQYSADMKYWACVVMRNLCRKDKSRGDIRQCAYYKCGKWEDYARQFAKCRRCRQTKYCSKECQKSAWVFHRHWCEPAKDNKEGKEKDEKKKGDDEEERKDEDDDDEQPKSSRKGRSQRHHTHCEGEGHAGQSCPAQARAA